MSDGYHHYHQIFAVSDICWIIFYLTTLSTLSLIIQIYSWWVNQVPSIKVLKVVQISVLNWGSFPVSHTLPSLGSEVAASGMCCGQLMCWGISSSMQPLGFSGLGCFRGDLTSRWPSGTSSQRFCEVTCGLWVARKKDALMSQNANALGEEEWKWACSHRAGLQGNDTMWQTQRPACGAPSYYRDSFPFDQKTYLPTSCFLGH